MLCTGKVYYDLLAHADPRARTPSVAIGRVELLYPFPQAEILELVEPATRTSSEVVWVQEEPRNMGARAYMSPRLLQILPEQLQFGYIGRPERAASGEGYPIAHATEQNRIVTTALDLSASRSRSTRASCPASADPSAVARPGGPGLRSRARSPVRPRGRTARRRPRISIAMSRSSVVAIVHAASAAVR